MRLLQEHHRRRAAARRTRRDASDSVQWLEGRALLAQTFSFPGLGLVANLPLSMLNPQQLVLDLTPTLANATVTGTNTSVTGTGTNTRLTGTSSFVATTSLPSDSASVHGHTVTVRVASNLLPSTGLAPSQYRFNFWPEDGGPPVSASVACFAPEFNTAQVGIARSR